MSCLFPVQSVRQDLHDSSCWHARASRSFQCAVIATAAEPKKKIKKKPKFPLSRSLAALNSLSYLPRLVFLEGLGGSSVGAMTSVTLLWRLAGVRRLQIAAELTGTLRTFSAALKQE